MNLFTVCGTVLLWGCALGAPHGDQNGSNAPTTASTPLRAPDSESIINLEGRQSQAEVHHSDVHLSKAQPPYPHPTFGAIVPASTVGPDIHHSDSYLAKMNEDIKKNSKSAGEAKKPHHHPTALDPDGHPEESHSSIHPPLIQHHDHHEHTNEQSKSKPNDDLILVHSPMIHEKVHPSNTDTKSSPNENHSPAHSPMIPHNGHHPKAEKVPTAHVKSQHPPMATEHHPANPSSIHHPSLSKIEAPTGAHAPLSYHHTDDNLMKSGVKNENPSTNSHSTDHKLISNPSTTTNPTTVTEGTALKPVFAHHPFLSKTDEALYLSANRHAKTERSNTTSQKEDTSKGDAQSPNEQNNPETPPRALPVKN